MTTPRPDPQATLDALQAHLPRLRQDLARFFPATPAAAATPALPRAADGLDRTPADAEPR